MAKAIALEPEILNPKIVLVTDRIDLDDQLWRTFVHCGKEPVKAPTGAELVKLLRANKESVITTTIFKFEAGVKGQQFKDESKNIFVLVDEGHRTQYGEANARMQKVLPNACYLGFTGTPLMKKEKNTAQRFGGIIDKYTIDQAVEDKAVVPLLYEGRHIQQEVDRKAIDKWFEVVTAPLSSAQRADLKRKFASADQLNKADRKIYLTAFDISEHFRQNWQGTGFKAQLVTDSKASALKFKEYLDEFGHVTSEVLISAPDTREGNEDIYTVGEERVQAFWGRVLEKYGNEKRYNTQVINAFLNTEEPEIIIVVDKLITGFDAPKNTVLYLARNLKDHSLLQAIARVNRLYEGKDFGYVIDYYGVLEQLGEAMNLYSTLTEFDPEDLADALTDVTQEVGSLAQKHSELWDIFKAVRNKADEEAYEQLLADDEIRQRFYDKFSAYNRTLGVALSTVKFLSDTPEDKVVRYKKDLAFFSKLRVSVKRRYAEEVDYKEYEAKVQKLIDTHVTSDEVLQITPPVNIFDQDKFQAEVEKLQTAASKADTIAYRTKKTITEKMEEDPFFYRRFSKVLEEAIEAYRLKRISDAEYLNRVTEVMNSVLNRTGDDTPPELRNRDVAKAFYGVVNEVISRTKDSTDDAKHIAARAALQIDEIILKNRVVDWTSNIDAQNAMRNEIDDYLYELKEEAHLPLTIDDMDMILENAIDIAKARYA
jgi:type I restriction enzyme, R subunit